MAALARAISVFFYAMCALLLLVLAAMVYNSFFAIKANEEGMLFRFGRLHPVAGQEILKSGTWYFKWPYPVDVLKVIPAQRSVTVTTRRFMPAEDPNRLAEAQRAAAGGAPQPLRPGYDGYLLTGDANIMHLVASMTYRVSDAKRYHLAHFEDPAPPPGTPAREAAAKRRGTEYLLESLLENATLLEVGARPVDEVFRPGGRAGGDPAIPGGRRDSLSEAVKRRVTATIERLDVGVEVLDVSFVEIQAPLAVQSAFSDVFSAAADRQTEIARALAGEKQGLIEAEGKAARILGDARAYKSRVVENVSAFAAYFATVLGEYEKNPETMLVSLYADTLRDVLKVAGSRYVVQTGGPDQELRVMINPEPEKPKPAAGPATP
jgi:regulator of protease activity HflC (stomatin/prohibitin superfamily)